MSTGKNAVIDWKGTLYACLTDVNVQGNNSVVSIECSTVGTGAANTKKGPGANEWTAGGTLVLEDNGSVTQAAIILGDQGALSVFPQGNTAGQPEYAWANATVSSLNDSAGVTAFNTLVVSWACDGEPTIGDAPVP